MLFISSVWYVFLLVDSVANHSFFFVVLVWFLFSFRHRFELYLLG